MKRKFSTAWNSSTQPRKQRKYLANAPLHLKKKLIGVYLSKDLQKKHNKRNIPVIKGDTVKIMRGKFKKKIGKVVEVKLKLAKIMIEGIQVKKADGSKVNVPMRASNLQIIELHLEDRKRMKKLGVKETVKAPKEDVPSKEIKEKKTETPKKAESKIKIKETKENKK